jgi:Peptidase family M1 domain
MNFSMQQLRLLVLLCFIGSQAFCQALFRPQNIQKAYTNKTRSMDGKPGENYWQNKAKYDIKIAVNPPSKTVNGSEEIVYINNSPGPVTRLVFKLIMNIHKPGVSRQGNASPDYLTNGIVIDKYLENDKVQKFGNPGSTVHQITLAKPIPKGDSVKLNIDWHFDLSEESGREGKLDSTSFHLAYFYPRVAVLDDVHGWDRMSFVDAQEFYNDFNDYKIAVTVPQNFVVWGTGDLLNPAEVLQKPILEKYNASFTSDSVINVVTQADIDAKKVSTQNNTNTWRWQAKNISDVAYCVSNHYVWDAASVVVDTLTGRRASCQAAYNSKGSGKFYNQAKNIRQSLWWFSRNWPGVPYPFPKSTIIQGFADMEYPMMANDSPQSSDSFQRFIAQHEIAHTYFPFYMGINEHRYGFMDEGWTTAFENMISHADSKEKGNAAFKGFRVNGWALNPSDETQIPIITPTNILSGQALGHNEYGKAACAYLALKDMLGDNLFKKSLHGFMDRWNGKHPIPWDMFNSFNDVSGKNLNWFWENWFFSSSYMDVAVDKVLMKKKALTFDLLNVGGFAIPFDVVVQYEDKSLETIHYTAAIWENNLKAVNLKIPAKKKIVHFKIETDIFVDAEASNNTWGKKL